MKRLKKCKLESALCVEVFLEICSILSQINCQLSKKENKIKKITKCRTNMLFLKCKREEIIIYMCVFYFILPNSFIRATQTGHRSADWPTCCIGRGFINCQAGDWLAGVMAPNGSGLTVASPRCHTDSCI